ncbi:PR-1-like protein [Aspergillus heteromorphus CBS 117.55]|uniref:PR-1-like protein n=1 Tax=Aspergillus heteromorphus CBS 117.55 TaxID=1448321 RepID=A0A317VZV3_9EURO|nr:PR-1-like protein [Aspergillus heteromorphus CBS 117.55]PWY77420.1 PR-1-like protein [Aspergillus heteromorphus CBS 117.55]
MRYSLALGALCAAGAMAHNVDKRAYVTDWTVVTETITVTDYLTPTAYADVAEKEVVDTTTAAAAAVETSSVAAVPVVSSTSTSSVVTPVAEPTTSVVAVEPTTTVPAVTTTAAPAAVVVTSVVNEAAAAVTSAADDIAAAATSVVADTAAAATSVADGAADSYATSWSTAWTSAWTSSATATTLATSTSSSATSTATNAYQSTVLFNHNIHRSNHSASSVEWSADLETSAYALAAKCVYEHDTSIDGGGYGQNIGYGVEASAIGEMITNLMYNDEMGYYTDLYGEADPSMTYFDNWGHFSQIVWKATTHVGCATVTCASLGNVDAAEALPFTVCNYSPAGNYEGEYGTNVGEPLGQAVYVAS